MAEEERIDIFELLKKSSQDKEIRARAEDSMRRNAYNYPPKMFERRFNI